MFNLHFKRSDTYFSAYLLSNVKFDLFGPDSDVNGIVKS